MTEEEIPTTQRWLFGSIASGFVFGFLTYLSLALLPKTHLVVIGLSVITIASGISMVLTLSILAVRGGR